MQLEKGSRENWILIRSPTIAEFSLLLLEKRLVSIFYLSRNGGNGRKLNDFGPKYGYFPKASKYWLICKTEEIANKARRIFENTGINITQTAQKLLGAVIVEVNSCQNFHRKKMKPRRIKSKPL